MLDATALHELRELQFSLRLIEAFKDDDKELAVAVRDFSQHHGLYDLITSSFAFKSSLPLSLCLSTDISDYTADRSFNDRGAALIHDSKGRVEGSKNFVSYRSGTWKMMRDIISTSASKLRQVDLNALIRQVETDLLDILAGSLTHIGEKRADDTQKENDYRLMQFINTIDDTVQPVREQFRSFIDELWEWYAEIVTEILVGFKEPQSRLSEDHEFLIINDAIDDQRVWYADSCRSAAEQVGDLQADINAVCEEVERTAALNEYSDAYIVAKSSDAITDLFREQSKVLDNFKLAASIADDRTKPLYILNYSLAGFCKMPLPPIAGSLSTSAL